MAKKHPHLIKVLIFALMMSLSSCSLPTIRESTNVDVKTTAMSPTSESSDTQSISNPTLGPLVGRHPIDWLPTSEKFYLQHSAKYIGAIAKRNEDRANETNAPAENLKLYNQRGRIISYGYIWNEEACSSALYPAIYYQSIEITLYTTPNGALEAYENVLTNLLDSDGYVSQNMVLIGDQGAITQVNGEVCGDNARSFRLTFQRYNSRISINLRTLYGEYDVPSENIQNILMEMGADIDQIIIDEAKTNPGTSEDLLALQQNAETIKLPVTASNSNSNNDSAQSGYIDDGTSQECVDLSVSDAVGPCYYYSVP